MFEWFQQRDQQGKWSMTALSRQHHTAGQSYIQVHSMLAKTITVMFSTTQIHCTATQGCTLHTNAADQGR
jgi:hypothetical protein